MNSKAILAIAAFAAIASTGARAEGGDPSEQFAIQFQGSRTRAEVMAEAAKVPAARDHEPAGSRAIAAVRSTVDRAVVRAQAAEALRLGQIPSGEVGHS